MTGSCLWDFATSTVMHMSHATCMKINADKSWFHASWATCCYCSFLPDASVECAASTTAVVMVVTIPSTTTMIVIMTIVVMMMMVKVVPATCYSKWYVRTANLGLPGWLVLGSITAVPHSHHMHTATTNTLLGAPKCMFSLLSTVKQACYNHYTQSAY